MTTTSFLFEELKQKTSSILAKKEPDITLAEHTYDTLVTISEYFAENEILWIEKWDKDLFPFKKVKDLLFTIVYFHDIGKATQEFQSTLNNKTESFHPLYAAFVLPKDLGTVKNIPLGLLSILNHHTPYYVTSEGSLYEQLDTTFPSFINGHEDFFKLFESIRKVFKSNYYSISLRKNTVEDVKKVLLTIKLGLNNFNTQTRKDIERIFYFISGGLVFADRVASEREFNDKNFVPYFRSTEIKTHLSVSIENFNGWRNFQIESSQIDSSVFIEIPTGEGKTEASLLWAQTNLKNKYTKIIYTLPTRVSSNKMYERLKEAMGNNDVALVHSDAKFILEEESLDNGDKKKLGLEYFLRKYFFLPLTVCTIDSFLVKFLHSGRWDVSRFNLQNSLITVDEVHSYNPKLLGFLLKVLTIISLKKKPCLKNHLVL